MDTTAKDRGALGHTLLYDPGGTVKAPPGVHRVGWSPVEGAKDWSRARRVASSMVRTALSLRGTDVKHGGHWSERAESLLGPLLHAAALENESMRTVLRWVNQRDGNHALSVLKDTASTPQPTDLLMGILNSEAGKDERAGIWSTASGVLSAYNTTAVLASTERPFLNAKTFCLGTNTLYICATGQDQRLFAPLVVGMLGDVRDAVYQRALGRENHPPVVMVLDEAANIAPLPDLPTMVSEGGGQGLIILACMQDLTQARARWGPAADGFLTLFNTTLLLRGIKDMQLLEMVSKLAGEVDVPIRTVGSSVGPAGRVQPSESTSTIRLPLLSVDAISRGSPDVAIVVDAYGRVGWLGLTPAHRTSPFNQTHEQTHEQTPAGPAGPAGGVTDGRTPRPPGDRGWSR